MFPTTITIHNVHDLQAVLAALHPAPEAPGKPSAVKTAPSKPTAEAGPSTPARSDAAPAKSTEATKPAAAAPSAVDYPTLQKAVAKLFAKDAKAPVQIAKDLNFDTFKAMPADKWAAALAAVNAKLAEIEVA